MEFIKNYKAGIYIPPMLLMTFVENIFKHGIDKIGGNNRIRISLDQQDGQLHFSTTNSINQHAGNVKKNGLGLKNLHQRLTILYGTRFELNTSDNGQDFTANLKIPLP